MIANEKIEADQAKRQLDDIRKLAMQLAIRAGSAAPEAWMEGSRSPNPLAHTSIAQQAYSARRARERFFDADLFGEPVWDILLDLYVQMNSGRTVSITSACIASSVPPTTALRWIAMLVQRGLVKRTSDPRDARRTFIELTKPALLKFNEYFEAVGNGMLKP